MSEPGPILDGSAAPLAVLVALRIDAAARHTELLDLAEATGSALAYLQAGEPGLLGVLDRAAADGVTTIRLVQVPGETGKPGRSWLRRVAGDWVRSHPDVAVTVAGRDVTGGEAPLQSPAWEHLPDFGHHVLVCRGPRCAARDAESVAEQVSRSLTARGIDDDAVLVSQTGCLYPCNHAPVVAVHPADAWYGRVGVGDVDALLADQLDGTSVLAGHRLAKGRPVEG